MVFGSGSVLFFSIFNLFLSTQIEGYHLGEEDVFQFSQWDTEVEAKPEQSDIKTVHLIYMNHLDVGYDGISPEIGFINNIVNKYFHVYFPRAIQMGRMLKEGGYNETFIYTTHPWLVDMFLHCPPDLVLAGVKLVCPVQAEIEEFEAAVKSGVINWHAGPMNLQPENSGTSLLKNGIQIGLDLDKRFNIDRKYRVLSQRDVPGMTQAAIPVLLEKGISAVSVGVNDRTATPDVPSVFVWKYNNKDIIGIWHKGGYPDNAGKDPKHPGGLSVKDCHIVPGCPDALCFAFRTDNSGPPVNITEIQNYFAILTSEFPEAKIKASTFDNFVEALMPYKSKLPVVTKEIGDTWIMGIASDPQKSADYRAIARKMQACFDAGECKWEDVRVRNANRFLIKQPEHTWGLPSVMDNVNWQNEDFQKVRKEDHFVNCEDAWTEQRAFNDLTVKALEDHPVVKDIMEERAQLKPQAPDLTDYEKKDLSETFKCEDGITALGFSSTGAINQFTTTKNVKWASNDNRLAEFMYRSYDEDNFKAFAKVYNYMPKGGAGFDKPNVTLYAKPESKFWSPQALQLYQHKSKSCEFHVKLQMQNSTANTYYGAPKTMWVHYNYSTDFRAQEPGTGFDVTFQWFDKTTTRLPEAMFLMFSPVSQTGSKWILFKSGSLVDPMNVVLNGSQTLHAVDDHGVYYGQPASGIQFRSLDVPLVCPATAKMEPTAFAMPLTPITDPITGMAYNFYNNVWNTNYIFWYPFKDQDKDFKARFRIQVYHSK